jgi:LysR family glycine cleavage system transcriptional activator
MRRRRIPPLNHLRAFEVAARHESFTRAADELCVTQGAISRHVKALEDHLGVELFERGALGVKLHRGGALYAAALTRALDRIATATEEVWSSRGKMTLTVQGFTTLLMRWLIPRLPGLQADHPQLEVRLHSSPSPADFLRDRVDVAILYGDGNWSGLQADLLFRDELMPVCSPAYLRRNAQLLAVGDLGGHDIIHHNRRREDWPQWLALAGSPDVRPRSEQSYEDLSVVYECALAGLGIVMGQAAYLQRELESGQLVAPFPDRLRRDRGFYLACLSDQADAPHISGFRDWLLSTL